MKSISSVLCPSCRHDKCAPGTIDRSDVDGPYPSKFFPAGARNLPIQPRVRLYDGNRFYSCLKCGLVWGCADPGKVTQIVARFAEPSGLVPVKAPAAPATEPACPACGHTKCVSGSVDREWDPPLESSFRPDGIRYWYENPGARLREGTKFYCCLKCGLVWGFTESEKVIDILAKLGVTRGELPARASYFAHLVKWVLFLLASGVIAAWLFSISHV